MPTSCFSTVGASKILDSLADANKVPTELSYLRRYGQQPERLRSSLIPRRPLPEIQASLILYLPFLVRYRRPDLRYEATKPQKSRGNLNKHNSYSAICRALNTSILGEDEWDVFISSLNSRMLHSRLPTVATLAVSTTIPVVQSFETFTTSRALQQLALTAGDHLYGYNPLPPGDAAEAEFHGYEWLPEYHNPVVTETIRHLVSCTMPGTTLTDMSGRDTIDKLDNICRLKFTGNPTQLWHDYHTTTKLSSHHSNYKRSNPRGADRFTRRS